MANWVRGGVDPESGPSSHEHTNDRVCRVLEVLCPLMRETQVDAKSVPRWRRNCALICLEHREIESLRREASISRWRHLQVVKYGSETALDQVKDALTLRKMLLSEMQ